MCCFSPPLIFHPFFYGIVIRAKLSLSRLGLLGLGGHAVMLLNVAARLLVWCVKKSQYANVHGLPGVVDPDIANGLRSQIPAVEGLLGKCALLRLILVVKNEDAEGGLLLGAARLLLCLDDILLELADGVLECCPCVIDLVDNENVLANQVGHLEGGKVKPLGTCDLCTGDFDLGVVGAAELLVQGETDGLDGDVG
jgi:hypothetical protein